ncbi:Transthyretin-like family protein [Ancylostoma ceylanicum]|uniref:Transthyretin-like family protein n=1 Tax=Ancylostoma ceylanicum TaxID=53326 RepID=A0A0D6LQ24_9BILA|nr:Transthyretin-like family protein [Ancylostoma ceylanicum]
MFLNILVVLALAVSASAHTIRVRGAFLCERNHRLPVFVELMEYDTFKDDLLNWTQTEAFDMFEVTGTEKELFGIMPYLKFDENLIVNLGRRKGIVDIDIGDIDLDDPKTKTEIRDKFAV